MQPVPMRGQWALIAWNLALLVDKDATVVVPMHAQLPSTDTHACNPCLQHTCSCNASAGTTWCILVVL